VSFRGLPWLAGDADNRHHDQDDEGDEHEDLRSGNLFTYECDREADDGQASQFGGFVIRNPARL
jgi:hypothetical protein